MAGGLLAQLTAGGHRLEVNNRYYGLITPKLGETLEQAAGGPKHISNSASRSIATIPPRSDNNLREWSIGQKIYTTPESPTFEPYKARALRVDATQSLSIKSVYKAYVFDPRIDKPTPLRLPAISNINEVPEAISCSLAIPC